MVLRIYLHINTVIVLLNCFGNFCLAGENEWTTSGPEGGSIYSIAIHPQNPNIAFIATIENGIYKSSNSGEHWIHIAPNAFPEPIMRMVAIHPFGPDTMYATTTRGMYRSNDAGESWELLPNPDGLYMEYPSLVINPAFPNMIFSAGWFHAWKSTDGGQSWNMMLVPGPDPRFISVSDIAIDPMRPNVMYLAGPSDTFRRALFKSEDFGETWFDCMNNIDTTGSGWKVVIDPVNSDIIYFVRLFRLENTRCLWKSINGGSSWVDITPDSLHYPEIRDLLILPNDHNILLACTSDDGVLKSTDGGQTWSPSNYGLRLRNVSTIEIDTVNNIIFLGTYQDGMYRSTDEGANWQPISANLFMAGYSMLSFQADLPEHMIVTSGNGPFVSSDGGGSWQHISFEPPCDCRALGILFDELEPLTAYFSLSPFRTSDGLAGFARSIDGGNSWTFIDNGLPSDNDYGQIAISYRAEGRRIFLSSYHGLFASDDGGTTWRICDNGLPIDNHYGYISVAPNSPEVIAVGEGYEWSDIQNHIYLSLDGGESWVAATPLPEVRHVFIDNIRFDPTDDNHFYLIYFGVGLFKTSDMGQNWSNITSGIPIDPAYPDQPWLSGLAINPYNPSNLLIISYKMGVYQSNDAGHSWLPLNTGLDTMISNGQIYFVPGDTSKLYLATSGRSVWSIHRTTTGVEEEPAPLPEQITLAAYPNPFNSQTTISAHGLQEGQIAIYDLSGREVARFNIHAGRALLNAEGLSSGVYFARVGAMANSPTLKLVLLK